MNQRKETLREEVREKQARPVAGIWACNNCGRRIQVITESTVPKKQPFVCVCGHEMNPGEEHATPEGTVAEELAAVDKETPAR